MNDRPDTWTTRRRRRFGLAVAAAIVATLALTVGRRDTTAGPAFRTTSGDTWLSGTVDERLALVAKHLRGFDVAMLETGHRYVDLYWAGRDRNWAFAQYQIDKIRTAVANGVERRPKRGASAKMLDGPLGAVEQAVKREDAAAFDRAFTDLTQTCNACHQVEGMPFVTVGPPTARISPVQPRGGRPTKTPAQQ